MSDHRLTEETAFEPALERELRQIGRLIAFPDTPDIASLVRPGLAARPQPATPPRRHSIVTWPWLAVAAVILLTAIAAVASTSVRNTVADLLGVPGIRIEFDEETPTVQPSPSTITVGLGERTKLESATVSAGFDVLIPDPIVYGNPDDLYLRKLTSGRSLVTFIYLPDERIPEAAETGVGLLLMQFVAPAEVEIMVKSVMGEGNVQQITINGDRGYWIEGSSSLEILNDPSAPTCCTDDPRPTANVLLWQADGVTYRLESALTRAEAIAVAESMMSADATPEP